LVQDREALLRNSGLLNFETDRITNTLATLTEELLRRIQAVKITPRQITLDG
jgi:hypothetical protein